MSDHQSIATLATSGVHQHTEPPTHEATSAGLLFCTDCPKTTINVCPSFLPPSPGGPGLFTGGGLAPWGRG